MNHFRILVLVALTCAVPACTSAPRDATPPLWRVYENSLKGAKYVDLTHTITPNIPVWAGFADSTFAPARAGSDIEGFAKKGGRLHLREARLRGDRICAEDGSAQHAAQPARPLGA